MAMYTPTARHSQPTTNCASRRSLTGNMPGTATESHFSLGHVSPAWRGVERLRRRCCDHPKRLVRILDARRFEADGLLRLRRGLWAVGKRRYDHVRKPGTTAPNRPPDLHARAPVPDAISGKPKAIKWIASSVLVAG